MSVKLLAILGAVAGVVQGHTVISYPGWRGNNLILNETFPFGMQWMYPCGGIGPSSNRTAWPINGGALAFQPGWFAGHLQNLMYVNLCTGAEPQNCSLPMVPPFQIRGPSDKPYPGTVCLPQVSLPEGFKPKNGDLASIQLVQALKHGGVTYNCADIIFTDNEAEVPPVTTNNCFNSSDIRVSHIRIVPDDEPTASQTTTLNSRPTSSTTSGSPPASSTPAGNGAAGTDASLAGQLSAMLMFMHLM